MSQRLNAQLCVIDVEEEAELAVASPAQGFQTYAGAKVLLHLRSLQ